MKLLVLTGAILALTVSVALAKPPGTQWTWGMQEDVVDNDLQTVTSSSIIDASFTTKAACQKYAVSNFATGVPPPCNTVPVGALCGDPGTSHLNIRCFQQLSGTAKPQ